MDKNYTLSLSRWHKVAERLAKSYTEMTSAAKNTLNNTVVGGYLGESQAARLKGECAQARHALHSAFAIQDSLVKLRKALGEANTRAGVATELAEYDALCRRQKLLETILAAQSSDMVNMEDLPNLPKQIMVENRYDNGRGTVRVGLLDTAALSEFNEESKTLSARIYALADKISDLNRERLSLELPEEIARIAGL